MWDLGADRLEFTSRMCCVTLGNSLNLSVPQLLGLETVGIVQLLTRVMVMVNDITDMPWVLSPRSTLGWMEMDMQEVSEGELLGSAHVGEGKEATLGRGTHWAATQHKASGCDESYSGDTLQSCFQLGEGQVIGCWPPWGG